MYLVGVGGGGVSFIGVAIDWSFQDSEASPSLTPYPPRGRASTEGNPPPLINIMTDVITASLKQWVGLNNGNEAEWGVVRATGHELPNLDLPLSLYIGSMVYM